VSNQDLVAYYHWPTVWVYSPPPISDREADLGAISQVVHQEKLAAGLGVQVLREGMFIFDFSGWLPGKAVDFSGPDIPAFHTVRQTTWKRIAVLNTHLACLYTALRHIQGSGTEESVLNKMVLSPGEYIGMYPQGQVRYFQDGIVDPLTRTRDSKTYAPGAPNMADWRLRSRHVTIRTATLVESFRLLNTILQRSEAEALITVADLYVRSCKAYEEGNSNLGLITAWAVIERLLNTLWERYVEENREREIEGTRVEFLTGVRRKNLLKGRDYTASVISEVLSLTGRLPFDLYRDMSKVRKARNDWMHELKPAYWEASWESARLAVNVAERMLSLVEEISFETTLSAVEFSV
jgi:hypothetical protein